MQVSAYPAYMVAVEEKEQAPKDAKEFLRWYELLRQGLTVSQALAGLSSLAKCQKEENGK